MARKASRKVAKKKSVKKIARATNSPDGMELSESRSYILSLQGLLSRKVDEQRNNLQELTKKLPELVDAGATRIMKALVPKKALERDNKRPKAKPK